MTRIVIVPDARTAGELAADAIEELVTRRPDAVIGLATGSTPLATYSELAARSIDFSRVRGFALDEYVGLPINHPESYHSVIAREVTEPLGLDPACVSVPGAGPIETAGADYERAIEQAGGIDLQLLGIGSNGHIGFNEPGSSFASLTRVVALTEQTRKDNARFFESLDDVPTHAITQGLGTIRRARSLVLLAFGERKAHAVAAAVEGPQTARMPASVIQLHPDVLLLADEAAASQLQHADYYRHAWESRLTGR